MVVMHNVNPINLVYSARSFAANEPSRIEARAQVCRTLARTSFGKVSQRLGQSGLMFRLVGLRGTFSTLLPGSGASDPQPSTAPRFASSPGQHPRTTPCCNRSPGPCRLGPDAVSEVGGGDPARPTARALRTSSGGTSALRRG